MSSSHRTTRGAEGPWLAVALGAALTTAPLQADALPRPGQAAADGRVKDVDGNVLAVRALRGRPLVVVYEDKESKDTNAAFKADLARILREPPLRSAVVVAAIADVSAYDSWPAKGFVKDAIREESRKSGTTIWCDWDASFRRAFDLQPGRSNVVVIGRDGAVRFAAAGPLSLAQRRAVETLLRAEVAPR